MRLRALGFIVFITASVAGLGWWCAAPVSGASGEGATAGTQWNRAAAASYLDGREVWWQAWPTAKMDHGTICISCHTAVPYAMARPALRRDLHETQVGSPEKVLIDNVEKRVSRWSEMVPFYSDAAEGPGKTAESHATEAVMNAVVLLSYDRGAGEKDQLRPVTRAALQAAWALQEQAGGNAGGWIWQDFHLAPWESAESAYQGAAQLMLQLSLAPGEYAREADARTHIDRLKAYLQQHYATQPLLNQLYVYWASAATPGLLTVAEQQAVAARTGALQQADGGWRLASLEERERLDKTPNPTESDGYATALVLLARGAFETSGPDATLAKGIAWLEQHQQKDGRWLASSLNKQRDPESNIGLFMSDAATGYAVLALEQAKGAGSRKVAAR